MKKYLAALLTALLLLCMALSAGAVGPALTATEAYCIIDADTGLVLAQQNMNEELQTASNLPSPTRTSTPSRALIPATSPCRRARRYPCRMRSTVP